MSEENTPVNDAKPPVGTPVSESPVMREERPTREDQKAGSRAPRNNSQHQGNNRRNNSNRGHNNNRRKGGGGEPRVQEPDPNAKEMPQLKLFELQKTDVPGLKTLAEQYLIEDPAGLGKHDLIFQILKKQIWWGNEAYTRGVLEILPDKFGFLRSSENNYLANPEDIYVSPAQIRRFGLRTGDVIEGPIRTPKKKERFFALMSVDKVNNDKP